MKHTLREWRRIKELSQQELGDLVGVSKTTVVHWEEHPERMRVERVKQVALALEISIDDIIILPVNQQNVESSAT